MPTPSFQEHKGAFTLDDEDDAIFPTEYEPTTPPRQQSASTRHRDNALWKHRDRFIPGRACTPTKQSLQLLSPPRTRPSRDDPFGPDRRRVQRGDDRFVTIRRPPPFERVAGAPPTPTDPFLDRRAVSVGAVWTVGGTLVTEGIASVTDGRGGRVTSGSNAPHFTSDFLRRHTPSEDERVHGDRLALAMDVASPVSMFDDSSPPMSPTSCSPRSRS